MVILYELTQLNARTKGAKINKGFDTFHIKQMIIITFLHIDLPNITIQITIYIIEHRYHIRNFPFKLNTG